MIVAGVGLLSVTFQFTGNVTIVLDPAFFDPLVTPASHVIPVVTPVFIDAANPVSASVSVDQSSGVITVVTRVLDELADVDFYIHVRIV